MVLLKYRPKGNSEDTNSLLIATVDLTWYQFQFYQCFWVG